VVAQHLSNSGIELLKAGKTREGIATVDLLVRQCGDSDNAEVRSQIAWARYNKATALRLGGQHRGSGDRI
jgi:hypothetical protein